MESKSTQGMWFGRPVPALVNGENDDNDVDDDDGVVMLAGEEQRGDDSDFAHKKSRPPPETEDGRGRTDEMFVRPERTRRDSHKKKEPP